MSKQLIIAEKPSVAQDIAKALGGFNKQDDYYESDDYVLSWCGLSQASSSGIPNVPLCLASLEHRGKCNLY